MGRWRSVVLRERQVLLNLVSVAPTLLHFVDVTGLGEIVDDVVRRGVR